MAYISGVNSGNGVIAMLKRLLTLPKARSFFLFGARGTGKSTLLQHQFKQSNSVWIDLLDPEEEERFARHPNELRDIVMALDSKIQHVIIDEIQKIPKLLDVVHSLIEKTNLSFILTGSSARKLKHGGANLLAGRAFVYHLFPFSFLELGEQFHLDQALRWGLLPKIHEFDNDEERTQFLFSYSQTYLKEEIWAEHFIKKLDPFRMFLEVSAQCNGKIINYANISRDVGADEKTIKEYFSILEDTLIGFFLQPFQHSFRKRLSSKPKFYLFDTGVTRALSRQLSLPLLPSTSAYGDAFEHFIILECMKLASYYHPEFRFSYLKTKDDLEIDLVVERPGLPLLFIEIKSNAHVNTEDLRSLSSIAKEFKNCEAVCFSKDRYSKQFDHVKILPWQKGIIQFFGTSA